MADNTTPCRSYVRGVLDDLTRHKRRAKSHRVRVVAEHIDPPGELAAERPALARLLAELQPGEALFAASAVDLCPSVVALATLLVELETRRCHLVVAGTGLDTRTMPGAYCIPAALIVQLNAELRQAAYDLGKPSGRARLSAEKRAAIEEMLREGVGKKKIASELRVGVRTVRRVAEEMGQE